MTDPASNLPQVEAAMAECARVERLRYAAGWTADEGGWCSPDGVDEYSWADEGWPLPEDADFANWFRATYHYEALDAGVDKPLRLRQLNPYPNAPATA